MDATMIWLGMIFGTIGGGYFLYGKKQANAFAMFSGFLLCCLPYFVPNPIILSLISLALMALPVYIHKHF